MPSLLGFSLQVSSQLFGISRNDMKVAVALAGQECKMRSAVKGVEIQKQESKGKPHLGC